MKISWQPCVVTIVSLQSFSSVVDSFSIVSNKFSKQHSLLFRSTLHAADHSCQNDADDVTSHSSSSITRRDALFSSLSLATVLSGGYPFRSMDAKAGLVQFPCPHLMNTYHFMRAGQSLLEEQDIWSTNPLFLTNRESALSSLGREQVQTAMDYLEEQNINPSLVKFSLAANAMDTADMISTDMQVGRNRLVPEYTYLDQRGIGKWEGLPLASTQEAVWAMDVEEAGVDGLGGRPPPNDDGTPNETLSNQVTRISQLFSLLESTQSGDNILLIFPDATGPALLSALIAGIPLHRVHELSFEPGEVRLDITYDNVRKQLPSQPSAAYMEAVARGKETLKELRLNPEGIISVKDKEKEDALALAKEREATLALEKETKRLQKQKALQEERERNNAARSEEMQLKEAERQRKREEMSTARDRDITGMDIFSLGAMSIAAALVSWKDSSKDDIGDMETVAGKTLLKNATSVCLPSNATATDQDGMSTKNYPELQAIEELAADKEMSTTLDTVPSKSGMPAELKTMESLIEMAPIEIPEFRSNENVKQTKIELAEKAMEDYMDQDDGGEDWLGSLADIIAEDDER